jgi:hypothetical protein
MFGLVVPRRRPLFGAPGAVGRMLIGLTARKGVGCFKSCASCAGLFAWVWVMGVNEVHDRVRVGPISDAK